MRYGMFEKEDPYRIKSYRRQGNCIFCTRASGSQDSQKAPPFAIGVLISVSLLIQGQVQVFAFSKFLTRQGCRSGCMQHSHKTQTSLITRYQKIIDYYFFYSIKAQKNADAQGIWESLPLRDFLERERHENPIELERRSPLP